MIRTFGLAVALSSLAAPAVALDVYECSFQQNADNYGYLSPTLVLVREPGGDMVTVVDLVIEQERGGPIEAEIVEENDKKFSVVWEIKVVSPENDYLRLNYRLSIQKGSLGATLSAKPAGYSNQFSARGTCVRSQA